MIGECFKKTESLMTSLNRVFVVLLKAPQCSQVCPVQAIGTSGVDIRKCAALWMKSLLWRSVLVRRYLQTWSQGQTSIGVTPASHLLSVWKPFSRQVPIFSYPKQLIKRRYFLDPGRRQQLHDPKSQLCLTTI
ncbi:uncharacterized protein LOC119231124 isoform X1 [Talpa occidentalis]|uniref:uncharacterized protein LOC119231124 isoform X1 n=1 Tax=Talpa occidentalis TaxID=50954 RepID=UPI0023F9630E|nr:uncharacterized protein LOC119231124 isoform X1 [Talpa occidentalis]